MNIIPTIINAQAKKNASGKPCRKERPAPSGTTSTSAPMPSIPNRWLFPPWL